MSHSPRTSPGPDPAPVPAGTAPASHSSTVPARVPLRAGISLKPQHYREILETGFDGAAWFEVHPENYMGAGGAPHAFLAAIRERYPLSLHGVGLSLGGPTPLDMAHLARLQALIERYKPGLVSEHLAWCADDKTAFNDLLPVPLTQEALHHFMARIELTQDILGRRILIENPSLYLALPGDMDEPDFLKALAERTGCGLLLDINNVAVSAANNGFGAAAYLEKFPGHFVEEIHLAGHSIEKGEGWELRIDDHGSTVSAAVWELYRAFIQKWGPRATLIEWDTNIPALRTLAAEAAKADEILQNADPLGPILNNSHAPAE